MALSYANPWTSRIESELLASHLFGDDVVAAHLAFHTARVVTSGPEAEAFLEDFRTHQFNHVTARLRGKKK